MSRQELEPLSAEALSMLDVERHRPDTPADIPDRVFEHLATSIAVGGGPAGGGGSGGSAPARPFAGTLSGINARTASLLLGAALVGGGIGAAIHARLAAPQPAVQVAAPSPSPSTANNVTASAEPPTFSVESLPLAPHDASLPVFPSANPSAGVHDIAGKDVDLGMERALIERARMASAHGDGTSALEALDRHAKDFPRGRLTEEREALAIQALVQAGRPDEARTRAARFRARFPSSVFLAAVNAALGSVP